MLAPLREGQIWQCRDQDTFGVISRTRTGELRPGLIGAGGGFCYSDGHWKRFSTSPVEPASDRTCYLVSGGGGYDLTILLWDPTWENK
jgi:hypothetical protein